MCNAFEVPDPDGGFYDRLRLELKDQPFHEIRSRLYSLLQLPGLKRCAIDATGLGMQLAEEARSAFGYKVEPVTFTPAAKETLAFGLRRDFEAGHLRIPRDELLRADLRALKKEVSPAGNLRFTPDSANAACDRTWAKALRQYAARPRPSAGAVLI